MASIIVSRFHEIFYVVADRLPVLHDALARRLWKFMTCQLHFLKVVLTHIFTFGDDASKVTLELDGPLCSIVANTMCPNSMKEASSFHSLGARSRKVGSI
jgi:hypothetical protein